jgi:hypothetical protein
LKTESGKPLRFVPPGARDASYEARVFQTGEVATRPDHPHDWFNALVWLAFPRAKARINALHARELPRDPRGRRGPLRDLLTVFDEGGAIVVCEDARLLDLLRAGAWKALFLGERERVLRGMKVTVFGHAVMEKALEPWPGITCKALVLAGDLDRGVADWLAAQPADASPRVLMPIPVFGYPGWSEGQDAAFYDDPRYFRRLSRA